MLVGRGTAQRDDPLLTARPPGPREATRIVLDSQASLSPDSQLVRTARETPVLVAVARWAPDDRCSRLEAAGCEVLELAGASHAERLLELLDELGRRRMTNLLVEGGGQLLGGLLDAREIDEAHVFLAATILGGAGAPSPIAGHGIERLGEALKLDETQSELLGNDLHIHGRITRGK